MSEFTNDWPDDADGEVFRRLRDHKFDFSRSYSVDYNVDFAVWPPSADAVAILEREFGEVALYPPDDDSAGFALFTVLGPVTYDGVTSVQRRASALMAAFGGICESWGVMQDAP